MLDQHDSIHVADDMTPLWDELGIVQHDSHLVEQDMPPIPDRNRQGETSSLSRFKSCKFAKFVSLVHWTAAARRHF